MVKLVQLLCPDRHCILMTCYEEGASNFIGCCEAIESMVGPDGIYKRQCMICGSLDLRFEESATGFKTLVEAAPHFAQTMEANLATRRMLDAQGKTFEKLP